MKKRFALLFFTLFLISCSSDSGSGSGTNPDNGTVLIRKIISTSTSEFGANTRTTTYTYNGKKLATINSADSFVSQFIYSGDLITGIKQYYHGNLDATIAYEYDASNRLIMYTEYVDAPETRVNRQMEYHYNTDGTMTASGHFFDSLEQQLYPTNPQHYFFNAADEVERIETVYTNGTQVANYTYDDKHNVFKNVTGLKKINRIMIGGYNANITSVTYTGYDSGYNEESAQANTYNYNAYDYPTDGTRSFPNNADMPIMTDQYIY